MNLGFSQQQQLSQQMKLSPQMLQSLSFLTMNSQELSESIYQETLKNPALEIIRSSQHEVFSVSKSNKIQSENVRLGKVTATGIEEAENFQSFLESRPDLTESLQEHLLFQLKIAAQTDAELHLGEKIIGNLDNRGFHILAPISLLDPAKPEETAALLEHCLSMIQQFEPVGCAADNVEHSLLIQARLAQNAPQLALYILDGRLAMLEKPRPAIVAKKINDSVNDCKGDDLPFTLPVTEEDAEVALEFIKTLDPNPARQFSTATTHYIVPDIRVKRVPVAEDTAETAGSAEGVQFQVELVRGFVPEVALSPVYKELADSKKNAAAGNAEQIKYVRSAVKEAERFLDTLRYRDSTIHKAALAIVDFQHRFFAGGPRYLAPLRMKDVAEKIGVHEATVSRIANGKYIQCHWGLFEIKYFFSSQVSSVSPSESNENSVQESGRSKESVKLELKEIILSYQRQNPQAKPLSDQKLSDLLAERGIKAARRTVAKYRAELNIESSYDRK